MPKGKKKTKAVPVKVFSTPALIRLPVIPSVKVTKELVQDVTDASFGDFVRSSKYTILDIWAPWCGPCKTYTPTVESVATQYEDKIIFGKLDMTNSTVVSRLFNVRTIPILLFFKEGVCKDTIIGAHPRENITEWIEKNI
jgi:thioredoxin 1